MDLLIFYERFMRFSEKNFDCPETGKNPARSTLLHTKACRTFLCNKTGQIKFFILSALPRISLKYLLIILFAIHIIQSAGLVVFLSDAVHIRDAAGFVFLLFQTVHIIQSAGLVILRDTVLILIIIVFFLHLVLLLLFPPHPAAFT